MSTPDVDTAPKQVGPTETTWSADEAAVDADGDDIEKHSDIISSADGASEQAENDEEAKAPNGAPDPQASKEVDDTEKDSTNTALEPITTSNNNSKKKAATFVYDPNRITLKFIFANRDGIHVILDCKPNDTVGEIKGALLSVWPEDMPECSGGDRLRLICMGKDMMMPDTRTLQAAEIPVFKTHPTPVNVLVRPEEKKEVHKTGGLGSGNTSPRASGASRTHLQAAAALDGGADRARGDRVDDGAACCCVVS